MTATITFLRLVFLFAVLSTAWCHSHILVTSAKPVCKVAELPSGAFIKITFEAPDLNKMAQGSKPGPVYLTITETSLPSAFDVIEEEEGVTHRKPDRPFKPISHEIKHESGSFVHTIKRDADVEICLRASAAATNNPMRFVLLLEEMGDEEDADSNTPPVIAVDAHLSSMAAHLNRIESDMRKIQREADLSKERDSVYHARTDAMNKATTFWPIVHVCILLATGFTQANHIVQFFKKRRII